MASAGLVLAVLAATPADAQVRAGMLTCNVAAGMGFVIGSQKNVTCNFRSVQGWQESYAGHITRLGLDVGFTEGGTIAWAVYAPAVGGRGALAGGYGGATAEATVIGGLVVGKEYDVVAVTRPGDAVARLMTDAFDAVIADQSLREGTGVDLLEKAARLAPQTVRILISGYADPRTLADAINRAAVSHFIEKPLNVRAVREAVRGAAPRRQRDHSRVMIVASAEDASATFACSSPVFGLNTSPKRPDLPSTALPPMKCPIVLVMKILHALRNAVPLWSRPSNLALDWA